MKKLLTFLTLLTLFFTTAGAEEKTITLSWAGNGTQNDGSTLTAAQVFTETANYTGTANAATCATANTVYIAKQQYGLKIGKSGGSGNLIIGITPQVMPSKVVFSVAAYSASNATTVKVKLNGVNEYTLLNASKEQQLQNVTVEMDGMTQLTNINITATKYSHLKSITIYYEDGSTPVTPRVETPVITLSQDAPYYVGDNVTASITCGTEGAAIVYSLDNGTTWNPYSTAVEIPSATAGTVTIKAKATKADYLDSYEATQEVNFVNPPTTFSNLAAVNGCDDGTEFEFTAQTVVLGKYNKQLYIVMPDNSAGTLVFGGSNWSNDYTYGKVVSSGWSGSKTTYNDKPEVEDPSNFTLNGTEAEVTPIVITSDADLKKTNFGRYAVIKNVQVDDNGSFSGITTYNQFHPDLSNFEAGRYDVYGVIGWNKGSNDTEGKGQFMPLKYVEHIAAYTVTVNQPAAGGSISADAETADAGEEITLTATPAAGYQLASWTVKDADDNDVTVINNKFTMPASNVTVTAAFEAIKYAVNVNVTPANSGEVWVQGGCTVENNVSVSTVGTTVTVKLHSKTNYQVDGISVVDADNNEITATLTSTAADGNTYTFVMPASAVTVTGKFHAYVPDVYFLAGELSNWDNGVKMTYDSENNKYNLRVYFSDEYGYFRFRAGDNTYASGAEGDWWGLNGSTAGETATLYKGSTKRFRVPAGIYDIEVGQVFDDPTTSSNPNWWGQTTVKVTKVEPTLTFTPAAGEIVSGSSVSVSSNLYDLLSAINSEVAENDVTNMVKTDGEYAASVTLDADATVTGRAEYGYIEQTATAEYTIMQENTNTQYKLIKSANDLVNGKKYLVVGTYPSAGKTFVMGAYSEPRLSGVDATPENEIIEATADMRIVTLEAVGTNWALKTDDGYVYTNSTTSNGYAAYVETQEPAVITFEDESTGELNIGFVNNTDKPYLTPNRWGNSSNYIYAFGGYAKTNSVTSSKLFLYRQVEEVVTLKVETPVITPGTGTYAEAKDVEITCSTPGATIWYKYGNMTDYAEYTEALTISENTTLSAYATKDGYNDSDEATATYTFSELSDEIFTLVTSEDQLIEGNEYIIVAATDTYKPALGAIESRNGTAADGYTFATAGDYSELTLAAESDVNILTLGKVDVSDPNDKFYWTFKQKDGKYIYVDKSGGAIDVESQSNYSNLFKISIGAGSNYNNYATIQGSANYQIEYREDNSKIFRHYASSNVNQTGNVYRKVLLYTRGATVTPSVTLRDLCQNGVETKSYKISNDLQVAYVDIENNVLWVKDADGQSIWSTSPAEDDDNFPIEIQGNTRLNQADYDQSNWLEVHLTGNANLFKQNDVIKGNSIKGTFSNKLNPTITDVTLTADDINTESTTAYAPNYYMAANFFGSQNCCSSMAGEDGHGHFFFMNPKPQEFAHVVWAFYSGNNTMTMPTEHNTHEFQGTFKIDMSMNEGLSELVEGTGYNDFQAIIRLKQTTSTMLKDSKPEGTEYIVYPLNITKDTPTAINGVTVNGDVKGVKYVNVAGMVSDVPFQGVNIVVTEYSDGSRSTSKMLRK